MRRSLRLVPAAWWLLLLGACADGPPTKPPRSAHSAAHHGSAHVTSARRGEGEEGEAKDGAPTSSSEIAPSGALSGVGPTSDQLAERYRKSRALAVQLGSGSYYSDAFAGRSTASGKPYEPRGYTAAHRTLPFGTVLRVTRVGSTQIVYVRVTDRGPYGPRGRILDLSRAAAERLGMVRAGVVNIKLEVVEYGPRASRRRRR